MANIKIDKSNCMHLCVSSIANDLNSKQLKINREMSTKCSQRPNNQTTTQISETGTNWRPEGVDQPKSGQMFKTGTVRVISRRMVTLVAGLR